MDASDLTPDEQYVLVGLVKLVVHADREISPEEREVLGGLQEAIGAPRWNELVRGARERFPTIEQLEVAAKQIEREDAQTLIHDVLVELAGSDEIIDAEDHVLRWVVQEWGLHEDEHEEHEEDEEDDDSAVESFVLLDPDEE